MSSFGSRKWYFIHAGHSQAHLVHGRNLIKSGVQLVLGTVCPGLLQKKMFFKNIATWKCLWRVRTHWGPVSLIPTSFPGSRWCLQEQRAAKLSGNAAEDIYLLRMGTACHFNTLEWCTTPEIAYVFHYCYVLLMFTNIWLTPNCD